MGTTHVSVTTCPHASHRPQSVPAALFSSRFHPEKLLAAVFVFDWPDAFLVALRLKQLESIVQSLVANRRCRADVVQASQEVVVPADGEGELRERGVDHFAG